MTPCSHLSTTRDIPEPDSTEGCTDCLREGGWWVHLRQCVECGHVACCDSSPARHATGDGFSARNRFPGVVRSVEADGVMALVEIEAGPFLITAAVTRDSVEAIWASVERLYRSGVHPAITVCVRRGRRRLGAQKYCSGRRSMTTR